MIFRQSRYAFQQNSDIPQFVQQNLCDKMHYANVYLPQTTHDIFKYVLPQMNFPPLLHHSLHKHLAHKVEEEIPHVNKIN